jgi:hypothetical protein
VVDSPGLIKAGVPVPWKVPDSTNGCDLSTFSTVMVVCWLTTPSFLHAANTNGNNAASEIGFQFLSCFIVYDFLAFSRQQKNRLTLLTNKKSTMTIG